MDFAISLPFWNSLDSVRRTHSDLEGLALVFFALLVVSEALAHLSDNKKRENLFDRIGIVFFAIAVLAEIAAYPYGKRDDALSEQVIGSLDAKATDAAGKASQALTDSSDAEDKSGDAIDKAGKAQTKSKAADLAAVEAQQKAADVGSDLVIAEGKLRQLQIFTLARHFNDPAALTEGLKTLKGKHIFLRSYVGDAEGWLLCVSLFDAMQKVQIDVTNECAQWPFSVGKPITGLTVSGEDSQLAFDAIWKGRPTGGLTLDEQLSPPDTRALLIFAGIKNPFWLPDNDLAKPSHQNSSKQSTKP